MNTYQEYGFAYLPPDESLRQIAATIQHKTARIRQTLGAITTRDIKQCAPLGWYSNPQTEAATFEINFKYGIERILGFITAKHSTHTITYADIGAFKDAQPPELSVRHAPKAIGTLCRDITNFGHTALELFGFSQPPSKPLPATQFDGLPQTAGIGLSRFNKAFTYVKSPRAFPIAIMNIGRFDQLWHFELNGQDLYQSVIHNPGGIIILEGRPDRTDNPNPHAIAQATDVSHLFDISTTMPDDFDRRFGLG